MQETHSRISQKKTEQMMDESLQRKTAAATRWSTITEVASRLVLPLVNMALARLLTPEVFGVVATVTMIVSFAEIFADAGFQKYIIQHEFKSKEELDQNTNVAFWTNLAVSLILWTLICLYSDHLAKLVGNPGLGNVVAIASLSLPILAFSSIQMSRFKRELDFKSLFYVRLISILIPIFVTIPLAFISRSYWSLIIGTIAGNLSNAIVLTIRSCWRPKFYYSFVQLKRMFSYSWWILLESVTTWMTSYSDTFIVSVSLSAYYLGLYKTSMVTVNQIMGLIVSAASGPLFVTLSRLQNNRKGLISAYNSYMRSLAFMIFPLSVGIWLFRDVVTDILLGNQWHEASDFIGLWGLLSSIALVLGTFANGLYNAIGKTFLSFLVSLVNLIIMIPLLLWAAPKGFECVSVSRSMLRVSFVIIQLAAMAFILKYPIGRLLTMTLPVMLPTLVMGVIGLLLRMVSQSMLWNFICIAVCILVYFGSARLMFKRELIQAFAALGFLPDRYLNTTGNEQQR